MCVCDYEPPEFYTREGHRANKQHRCSECGTTIQPGDKYIRTVGKWEGYFGEFKECMNCVSLIEAAQEHFECFCFTHGNIIEEIQVELEECMPEPPFVFINSLEADIMREDWEQEHVQT